jgi:hypothetical protein
MKNNRTTLQHSFLQFLLLPLMLLAQGVYAWEGAGVVSTSLPDTGRYIATNSFPANTLVLLTNLETEEEVEVKVYARLPVPGGGLLAEVSREAAAAIGLQSRSIGRIRLTPLSDPAVISRLSDDRLRSGDSDFDPQAALREAYGDEYPFGTGTIAVIPPVVPPAGPAPNNPMRSDPESTWPEILPPEPEPEIAFIPEPEPPVIVVAPEPEPEPEPPVAVIPEPEPEPPVVSIPEPEPEQPVIVVTPEPEPPVITVTPEEPPGKDGFILVPTDEQPPPAYTPPAPPPSAVLPTISGIRTITDLEYGRYYLQVGASNDMTAVEWELSQLQHEYPVVVLYMAATAYPYRILVGPVSQGEAGILLKRLQSSGYKNAFLRKG